MRDPRLKRYKYTFTFGASGLTSTDAAIGVEGEIVAMHVRTANFTNDVTTIVTLEDEDGYAYYQSASLNRNTNTNVASPSCLSGVSALSADISGNAGGSGGTVTVVMFVKETRY